MEEKKKKVLHRALLLKIQRKLTEREFVEIKHMCKAYLEPADLGPDTDFCTLVDTLESRGYAVSWKHKDGYSELIDVFENVDLPKIVELIHEHGNKLNEEGHIRNSPMQHQMLNIPQEPQDYFPESQIQLSMMSNQQQTGLHFGHQNGQLGQNREIQTLQDCYYQQQQCGNCMYPQQGQQKHIHRQKMRSHVAEGQMRRQMHPYLRRIPQSHIQLNRNQMIGKMVPDGLQGCDIHAHVSIEELKARTELVKAETEKIKAQKELLVASYIIENKAAYCDDINNNTQFHGVPCADIGFGSIIVTFRPTDVSKLEQLWHLYTSGELRELLEQVLITKKLKEKFNLESVVFIVTIVKQNYNECKDYLWKKNSSLSQQSHQQAKDIGKGTAKDKSASIYSPATDFESCSLSPETTAIGSSDTKLDSSTLSSDTDEMVQQTTKSSVSSYPRKTTQTASLHDADKSKQPDEAEILRLQAATELQKQENIGKFFDYLIQNKVTYTKDVETLVGVALKEVIRKCIIFVFEPTDIRELDKLWRQYKTGELRNILEQTVLTQELKKTFSIENEQFEAKITEEDYNVCKEILMKKSIMEEYGAKVDENSVSSAASNYEMENKATLNVTISRYQKASTQLVEIRKCGVSAENPIPTTMQSVVPSAVKCVEPPQTETTTTFQKTTTIMESKTDSPQAARPGILKMRPTKSDVQPQSQDNGVEKSRKEESMVSPQAVEDNDKKTSESKNYEDSKETVTSPLAKKLEERRKSIPPPFPVHEHICEEPTSSPSSAGRSPRSSKFFVKKNLDDGINQVFDFGKRFHELPKFVPEKSETGTPIPQCTSAIRSSYRKKCKHSEGELNVISELKAEMAEIIKRTPEMGKRVAEIIKRTPEIDKTKAETEMLRMSYNAK